MKTSDDEDEKGNFWVLLQWQKLQEKLDTVEDGISKVLLEIKWCKTWYHGWLRW